MALVVESGTGSATADGFASAATVDTYAENRGHTAWTDETDDDLKEAAIRRATTYLSAAFTWKGSRRQGRDQALAWPRYGVHDADGWVVASDAVPTEIVQACCELAVYELATPGGLSPTVDLTARVKRKKIGPIETEYAVPSMTADSARPILTLVEDLISGLLANGSNSNLVGTAARA